MAKKRNKILSFIGGLLGGGAGQSRADKKVTLATVVKSSEKFGDSVEEFLDTEYDYISYLRNRNGGGTGAGGLGGERGSRTQLDRSRRKRRLKFGDYGLDGLPRRKRARSKGMPKSKYSRWMQNRNARAFNQKLMKKYGFDRKQIDAFRKARIKGAPFRDAINIAKKTKKAGLITRTLTGLRDSIPNRPGWATRQGWGKFRPGVRERLWQGTKNKVGGIWQGAKNFGKKINPLKGFKGFKGMKMPGWARIPGLSKLKGKGGGPGFLGWLNGLLTGIRRHGEGQGGLQIGLGTGAEMLCGGALFAKASAWGGTVGAAIGAPFGGIGAFVGAPVGAFIAGSLAYTLGAGLCGGGVDALFNQGKGTEKKKFGGLVNGAAQCTDCASTSKHSGGAVVTSPTRGVLGGQKALVGEAQEAELILPMSKIGDALSAVYREGASTMVGATISFLTPLSGSPAVASVLGEARKLQSIVGTSDIEAETPQVPEIKQVKVKASNTETNNMEQKFNSGGFVTGGTGIDKVPARLTAGEFVMSKGAVKKFGAGTLASMNAAGGGTNRPTPSGGYNQGGKSFDRSHYGTPGYQIGQINPPTLVLSREEYTDHSTERTGKERSWVQKNITERDFEKFTEYDGPILGKTRTKLEYREGDLVGTETYESDIASIGVPDLYEHKDQLLSAIHAVPGYGHVTIKDVINSKVDMPLKQYMMILMTSDAQAATFAKKDAAHQADLELRGIDPSKGYSMGYDMNGGGLVPPAISPSTETSNIKPRPKKNREQLNNTPINITKKAKVKASIVPIPIPKPVVITKQVVVEKPVLKNRTLIISDQGKGVLVS